MTFWAGFADALRSHDVDQGNRGKVTLPIHCSQTSGRTRCAQWSSTDQVQSSSCRMFRDGDDAAQEFARALGAVWAGGSSEPSPDPLDAAIIFAPVGALVPMSVRTVRKGGRVICGGIHMSDIPGFPYADLWEERSIMSVANLTRQDGTEFFPLAGAPGVKTETTPYPRERANEALDDLREGRLLGAAVLTP